MEMLDIKSLKSPECIPTGTILVQHWLNSTTYFKVVGTTKKSVLVVQMPSKQTHFDHEGGGTGHQYKLPDEDRLQALEAAYKIMNKKCGFDVLSKKVSKFDFEDAEIEAKRNGEDFWSEYIELSNNREYLLPKRIMVKPTNGGGFYIPGYFKGTWCGPMRLWNGEEVSDYID